MKHLLLLCIFLTLSTFAYGLPKNMQAEQYMRGAKKAVQAKDYSKALQYFEKIKALKVKLPTAFYYFYGTAKLETGKPIEAKNNFDSYLTIGGHKAKYYLNALDKLEIAVKKAKDFNILSNGYFQSYGYEKEGLKVKNESLTIKSCVLQMQTSEQYLADPKEKLKFQVNLKNVVLVTQECPSYNEEPATCEVHLVTCGPQKKAGCASVIKWKKKGARSWQEEYSRSDEIILPLGDQKEAAEALNNALIEQAKACEAELMEELMEKPAEEQETEEEAE